MIAGWSSPVARQAHNLKVVGSNPAPATNIKDILNQTADLTYLDLQPERDNRYAFFQGAIQTGLRQTLGRPLRPIHLKLPGVT